MTEGGSSRVAGDHGMFVVGIGASAGGLEAIQTFFDHSRNDTGAAYVVVQHLSPDFKSMMAELLSKHTGMAIHTVTEPTALAPNSIYLIPPKRNLLFRDGQLVPEEYPPDQVLNLPINVFFRSLAENFGERAVAIVLSGTGSDGAVGVKSVREMGGVVMVQDEASARFDGMPHSAMATGMVDFVLSPQDMPTEIERYLSYKTGGTPGADDLARQHEDDEIGQILGLVHQETRVDFTQYKINTIVRRIERRIGLTQSHTMAGYVDLLRSSPAEVRTLGQELLISVTNFFRDPDAFDIVAREVMPTLVREAADSGELRIWVAGCATGEEAYTLAILVQEEVERQNVRVPFKIFATDIDRRAIERAATGVYHAGFMSNVSEERVRKYFTQRSDNYQVVPAIREKVIFAVHDLVKDPPFTRIDLITCRNLLIYFQPALQQRALARMLFALRKQGLLFLGPSESTGELSQAFDTVNSRWKILRKRTDAQVVTPGEIHKQTRYVPPRTWTPGHSAPTDWTTAPNNAPRPDDIVETAVNQYVPAGVALSENLQLIHIFGAVERYFRFPSGAPNFDVVRLARGDLSIPLATAVHKAMKDQADVTYNDVVFRDGGDEMRLTLRVRHCTDSRSERTYLLVFFEPIDPPAVEGGKGASTPAVDAQAKQRIEDLEQELQFTRESLQATIEELETSNEELQSSSEELMAANEELQSTNEELNSVNEELYTVNAEYQKKIDELIELNADMDQLLTSTSVAVLFLDTELRVRRFTQTVTDVVHVLERDVGRPLQHLSPRFETEDLVHELEHVRTSGKSYEDEIVNDEGRRFLMGIRPYGTQSERTGGLVVTFFEVSRLRLAEHKTALEALRLKTALHATGAGAIEWRRRGEAGLTFSEHVPAVFDVSAEDLPTDLPALGRWIAGRIVPDRRERFETDRLPCFDRTCPACGDSTGSTRRDVWRLADGSGDARAVEMTCCSLPTSSKAEDDHVVFVVRAIPE